MPHPKRSEIASEGPAVFGLGTLVGLVMSSMIGAGVYTTSGFALADLGTPTRVLWAWLAGAGVAICGATGYGAIAQSWSESGGEYVYLSRSVHPWAGFLAGWISLVAGFTAAIALSAVTLEVYVRPFFSPSWQARVPPGSIAIASIVLGGLLHGIHRESGVRGQNLLVAIKLGLVVMLIGWGAMQLRTSTRAQMPHPLPGSDIPFSWQSFAMSLVWISLSFSGFNAAIYVAGEAIDSRRNVPRAMILGTFLVSAIYMALNAVILGSADPAELRGKQDVAATAVRILGGANMERLVRAVIACGLLSSVASMVLAGPRVYSQMARDGVFPAWFAATGRVPRSAIALQVGLASFVASHAGIRELLSYMGFTLSLCSAAAVSTLFRQPLTSHGTHVVATLTSYLRERVVPAFYVLITITLAFLGASTQPRQFVAALATIVSGSIFYWVYWILKRVPEHE